MVKANKIRIADYFGTKLEIRSAHREASSCLASLPACDELSEGDHEEAMSIALRESVTPVLRREVRNLLTQRSVGTEHLCLLGACWVWSP